MLAGPTEQRVSQSITAVQIRPAPMRRVPAERGFTLLMVLVLGCIVPLAGLPSYDRPVEDTCHVEGYELSTASFPVKPIWTDLYSRISVPNLETTVHDISENTPNRIWYPLDKAPSDQLQNAWNNVNETLKSQTGGSLRFHLMTEQLNLVAVKNGSRPNSAPIIVAGVVSSTWTPGANTYGSSVAAVLETARILLPLNLTNDVYFVLVNTIASTYGGLRGSIGMASLLEDLVAQHRKPAVLFWFSPLLYSDGGPLGDRVVFCHSSSNPSYGQDGLISDIAGLASTTSGTGHLLVPNNQLVAWNRSGAFDAWSRGIPGFALTQYYSDPFTGTQYDRWNAVNFTYSQLYEAVGVVASVSAYLGSLNKGEAPMMTGSFSLAKDSTQERVMPLSGRSFVNVTINWTVDSLVQAGVKSPSGSLVYSRTESGNSIEMKYLVMTPGLYRVVVTNLGNAAISVVYSYTHWQDYDQDLLPDKLEFLYRTDSLSSDSDADLLSDGAEVALGTDPNNPDTDADGALDGIEILHGSNPFVQDTDGDTVLDGQEIQLGMDPTNPDSDRDGVSDGLEVRLGLNPLSNDTDNDGLDDLTELRLGTDPTSPDSDGDGLGDFFEALNGLNPLSQDSDHDGLSDSYEIEHCLNPIDPDTDHDGIPDGVDWAPTEHWIVAAPFVATGVFLLGITIWLAAKRHQYLRGSTT